VETERPESVLGVSAQSQSSQLHGLKLISGAKLNSSWGKKLNVREEEVEPMVSNRPDKFSLRCLQNGTSRFEDGQAYKGNKFVQSPRKSWSSPKISLVWKIVRTKKDRKTRKRKDGRFPDKNKIS